jgi:hypothetical protein
MHNKITGFGCFCSSVIPEVRPLLCVSHLGVLAIRDPGARTASMVSLLEVTP